VPRAGWNKQKALAVVRKEDRSLAFRVSLAVGVLVAVGLVLGFKHRVAAPADKQQGALVTLAGHMFDVEVADTPALRQQGLAGRGSLSNNSGMLFTFAAPDPACFWMENMQFNVDILWFDVNKRLIYQQQNLSPSSYPQRFCPPSPASYVVEINPGIVQLQTGYMLTP
jgi:uncharacterized membrane protein (UPF0127 family)